MPTRGLCVSGFPEPPASCPAQQHPLPRLLAPRLLGVIFLFRFLKIVLFYNLYTSNSAPGADVQALVSPFFLVCMVSSPLGPE